MEKAAEVSIRRVKMVSHDEHHLADMGDSKLKETYGELDDILQDKFDYKEDSQQTSALQRLEKMLKK